jgi:hypothetical protein
MPDTYVEVTATLSQERSLLMSSLPDGLSQEISSKFRVLCWDRFVPSAEAEPVHEEWVDSDDSGPMMFLYNQPIDELVGVRLDYLDEHVRQRLSQVRMGNVISADLLADSDEKDPHFLEDFEITDTERLDFVGGTTQTYWPGNMWEQRDGDTTEKTAQAETADGVADEGFMKVMLAETDLDIHELRYELTKRAGRVESWFNTTIKGGRDVRSLFVVRPDDTEYYAVCMFPGEVDEKVETELNRFRGTYAANADIAPQHWQQYLDYV